MKRKRYADEQIAFSLRQAESGTSVEEVCRKLGVSEATFYRWKKQFAGMGVVEIRRLKQLEEENSKLKRLVADLSLTRPCCRTCCAESSEAWRSSRRGGSSPNCLRRQRAAGLQHHGIRAIVAALPIQARSPDGAAAAAQGSGRGPDPLRLSTIARVAAAGGLSGEPQARLPALQ